MGRFERIANQRIYEQIVGQISQMLKSQVLRPGDRLPPERQLAEEFGVSRTAVREALSALCLAGLLEVRAGEGTFIRSVSEEGLVAPLALLLSIEQDQVLLRELIEVRIALEAESAALAAERWEPDDMEAIEAAMREMEQDPFDGNAGAEADWRFHQAIASASGNGIILQIMRMFRESLAGAVKHYRTQLISRSPDQRNVILNEHREIMEAIRSRDPEHAKQRMNHHLERVRRTLYPRHGDGAAS